LANKERAYRRANGICLAANTLILGRKPSLQPTPSTDMIRPKKSRAYQEGAWGEGVYSRIHGALVAVVIAIGIVEIDQRTDALAKPVYTYSPIPIGLGESANLAPLFERAPQRGAAYPIECRD